MASRFGNKMGRSTRLLMLDGGMGNYLQKTGMPPNMEIWSLAAMIDEKWHCKVIEAHREYLNAGADIITTNSYAVTPLYLSRCGKLKELRKYIQMSVDLAETARTQYMKEQRGATKPLIAGSIPPLMESYDANGMMEESKSILYYDQMVDQFKNSDIDLFLVETMSTVQEAKYVLNAMICNGLTKDGADGRDIYLFFTLREDGKLRDGMSFNEVMAKLREYLDVLPIAMIGANCCQPEAFEMMMDGLNQDSITMLKENGVSMGCYPNSYAPIPTGRKIAEYTIPERKDLPPEALYSLHFKRWVEKFGNDRYRLGLIGGCCGTFPTHIGYAVDAVNRDFPQLRAQMLSSKL